MSMRYNDDNDESSRNVMALETTSLLPTTTDTTRRPSRGDGYDASRGGVEGGGEEEAAAAALDEEDVDSRRRFRKRLALVVTGAVVVVSMTIMAAAGTTSSTRSNISNLSRTFVEPASTLQSSPSSSSSSTLSYAASISPSIATDTVDSLMDRWDEFKTDWWSRRQVQADLAVSSQLSSSSQSLESLNTRAMELDFMEQGRKFSAQVRQWWDQDEAVVAQDAAQTGQIVQHWWNHTEHVTAKDAAATTQAVGTWWNHTEYATAQDAAAAAEATAVWWDTVAKSIHDTDEEVLRKTRTLQHNFAAWWQTASADERQWWNQTCVQAQHMEETAADKEHVWWARTVQTVGEDWNRTEQIMGGAKHAVADDWDRSEHAVASGWDRTEHAVAGGWDRTEHAAAGGWDRTEHAAADDWDRTEHAVADNWNRTKAKEALWWNATEHWFHSHLREGLDDDDEMRQPLLYLNTSTAYSLLMNGYGWYDYSADFFAMQSGFDAQINQAYCGVASSAALLNSLRSSAVNLTLPVDPRYEPYNYATQTDLLDNKCSRRHVVRHNATFDGVFHTPGGVSMLQIKALLQCHLPADTWQVVATQVDPALISRDRFRKDIRGALRNRQARVILNFNRPELGQHGGGHFSPIASYSKEQDSFLIMDVAKYKYPPVWVSASRLYAAASTVDGCGDWDFPAGQDRLPTQDLLGSFKNFNVTDYEEGLRKLHCASTFRGYIIVQPQKEDRS